MRNKIFFFITIFCTIGIISLTSSRAYADSVTPAIYEAGIAKDTKATGKFTYKNESSIPVTINPIVSAYDPKTLQLITSDKTIFLRLDKETYTVQPGSTLSLNYEIIPPTNLTMGTYFNLIVLQKVLTPGYLSQQNQLGTIDTLSQLVVIHIFEKSDAAVLGISGEFAQITTEIVDKGIPFLKPTIVKYTYQNTTNYVEQPQGEIQVYDGKSSYAPIYKHINANNQKLYPKESIEETISISDWHISDILFGRKVVGRFYNGVDENSITKDNALISYYLYPGILIFVILLIAIIARAVKADKRSKTSKSNS